MSISLLIPLLHTQRDFSKTESLYNIVSEYIIELLFSDHPNAKWLLIGLGHLDTPGQLSSKSDLFQTSSLIFVWAETLHDNRTLYSQQWYVFGFFILTVFGAKMTSQDWQQKVVFDLWYKKLELLKELTEMSSNVKKVFVKLNWLKSYWAVNFVFSAILLLFLEIWWSLECHIFLTKWGFQKLFSHSSSSLSTLSKLLTCYGISWNLYFSVNLMTSFSRQKPLK